MILSSVSLFSAGLFGCEVSADYPEYDTDIRRKHLHVFGKINYLQNLDLISIMQFHHHHGLMWRVYKHAINLGMFWISPAFQLILFQLLTYPGSLMGTRYKLIFCHKSVIDKTRWYKDCCWEFGLLVFKTKTSHNTTITKISDIETETETLVS